MTTTSLEPIIKRQNRAVTCKFCKLGGLEWIATGGTPSNPSQWKLIPYGALDTAEIHTCRSAHTVATPTMAPTDLSPITTAIAEIAARVDAVEARPVATADVDAARVDAVEAEIAAVVPMIDRISDKLDTTLADLTARVDVLDTARPVVIHLPIGGTVNVGRQHNQFANLVAMTQAVQGTGVVYLVGEAGSFKTSAIPALAKALGVDFTIRSVGQLTMETDIFGYHDANGRYVKTMEWDAYVNGKLHGWDEFDAISAQGAVAVNAITSNGEAGFPDGMHHRHANTHFVAMGNTFGRGADAQYIGRSQLDAATLNRFVYLPWDTDWAFLGDLYGLKIDADVPTYAAPGAPRDLTDPDVAGWGAYVKRIHDIVANLQIRAVVGSRAVINGVKLLQAGVNRDLVEYSTIWAHLSAQDAETVKANM